MAQSTKKTKKVDGKGRIIKTHKVNCEVPTFISKADLLEKVAAKEKRDAE